MYPKRGSAEYNISKLEKLKSWLEKNPNKSPLVEQEVEALEWALEQLARLADLEK